VTSNGSGFHHFDPKKEEARTISKQEKSWNIFLWYQELCTDWFAALKGSSHCSSQQWDAPATASYTLWHAHYERMKGHIFLQHKNAHSHTTLDIEENRKVCLGCASPYPYNLALSPSDCHLFKPLEGHMRCQCHENNEAVQHTMCAWLQDSETGFYCSGMFKLMQCWQKCLDDSGDSME
jgi:hypothetical protein